jgi:hypothetical protein
MNRPQSLAQRIDAKLGTKGQKWKQEFVAMVNSSINRSNPIRLESSLERPCS